MNKRRMSLLALVALVALGASGCGYNTMQAKQQAVRARWSDVETLLQRRADLVPNLFEAAKAAGFQEQQVFGDIASARSRLLNATQAAPQGENGDKTPEQKQAVIDANNSFGATLGRLLVLTENYPQLRSNENFLQFQQSLEGTENRIAVARKDYNDTVQDYNTTRGSFPTVLFAKMYGFKEEPYFKAEEGSRQAPRLDANSVRRDSGAANATGNANR